MAIRLEFISVVVPIQTIEAKYPGGWKAYQDDNEKRIGKVMWFDNSLVRASGCMCGNEVDGLISRFVSLGFAATDFCIVDAFGSSQHADWIVVDVAERLAWLGGDERGEIVGRENFR